MDLPPSEAIPRSPHHADRPGPRRAVLGSTRPWSRIGPRLLVAVMVPVVTLSALGVVGVVQRYRDADAVSRVVTEVELIERTLHLYAGLVAEKTASESIVVAAALHISPAEAGRLAGFDIEAQLGSARTLVDAAIASGAGTILGKKLPQLIPLRAGIDSGAASEASVRSFFIGSVDVAESAWLAQMRELTQTSLTTVGSAEIRRAIAVLADTADAFISGAKETTAAGALTVPGVPGAATGATDLAASNALYTRAASGLAAELDGQGLAAWRHLIINDPDVKTFQGFLASLLQRPSGSAAGANIAEIAQTFRAGLIFQDHLRQMVDAAAAGILPLVRGLQSGARHDLERYLFALGAIGACSAAITIVTARKIVRPLRRLAVRAADVSGGSIGGAPLDERGPYEVASVARTFNEIVANLVALDATTLALAASDLDSPVLSISVPGRIGDSLRHSAEMLQQSIRDNEELRLNLEHNEARFRELADGSPDIIFRFSREPYPHFEYLSPSFERITGIPVRDRRRRFPGICGRARRRGPGPRRRRRCRSELPISCRSLVPAHRRHHRRVRSARRGDAERHARRGTRRHRASSPATATR